MPKRCFVFRLVGWVPVVLINAVAVWSYFAYVVILCFDAISNPIERALFLVMYHPFFVMFMASYWKTILSPPGFVPSKFYLTAEELESYESNENPKEVLKEKAKELPIQTYTVDKGIRYCEVCVLVKPDRGHHCSMCQRCILKMDHHCPWVNNCVGWANYKYFVLFLGYAILYTMYVALSSLKYFIKFWTFLRYSSLWLGMSAMTSSMAKGHNLDTRTSMHILFLFFVALMFAISLWSLLGFHCFLVAKNRSTLETFRPATFQHGPDKAGFDLGKMNNFRQIFGNKRSLWFLPVFTTLGNGINYRTAALYEPDESNRLLYHTYEENVDDDLVDDASLDTVTVMGNINLTDVGDSDGENTIFDVSNGKIHNT